MSRQVLVTGAAGFVGQLVARALLNTDDYELVLADVAEPPVPAGCRHPERARCVKVDLAAAAASASASALDSIVSSSLDSAVLLHGIMSSAAEADLDLGYRVNVDATRALLRALAAARPGLRVLYASSEAVYGSPVPRGRPVTERDVPTPETSYGCQKLICETLLADLTRRGLLSGFALRLPTIAVRPGAPSPAVTAFVSGIVREPLAGLPCAVPLRDRAWRHWLCSPRTLAHNLLVALRWPADALPPHRRAVNLPGFAVSVQDMLDALALVGGAERLALVREEERPELQSLLYSWPDDFDNSLALSLGMRQDSSFEQTVREYVEDGGAVVDLNAK